MSGKRTIGTTPISLLCSGEGETAWPCRCLAPQLVPFQALSERNFEQCSPAPASTGQCNLRKSQRGAIRVPFPRVATSELGGIIWNDARTFETNRATL